MSVTVHTAANDALSRVCAALRVESATSRSQLALTCVDSPVGTLLLGSLDQAVAVLEFSEASAIEARVSRLQSRHACELKVGLEPVVLRLIAQLSEYFSRNLVTFDVPLTYTGSSFQEQVWKELLKIPYGQTCSYGAVAQRLGDSGAMRAVGMANHHNPIAIVIPCHRVVNAKGDIGGYGGEVWRKRWLLDLEAGQRQFAF